MGELSWKHQTLIQSLLSRGPQNRDEFHKIFEGVTGRNPGVNEKMLNEYLLKINKELSYIQLELRAFRNQYDGEVYYGVVNNVEDEHSKLGSKYSVPQIAFYKGIIEAIAQDAAAQGCISNIDALHLRLDTQPQIPNGEQLHSESQFMDGPAALRNFSMSQKEKALEELVRDGWLSSIDGNIGLGIRSFLDLRSWFRLNEIPSCEVCNEAGVKAEMCPNEGCSTRIHKYCLIKKFSQRTVEKVCPGCNKPWPFSIAKAEAVDNEEESNDLSQPSNVPSAKKRRNSQSDNAGSGPSQKARLRRSARVS